MTPTQAIDNLRTKSVIGNGKRKTTAYNEFFDWYQLQAFYLHYKLAADKNIYERFVTAICQTSDTVGQDGIQRYPGKVVDFYNTKYLATRQPKEKARKVRDKQTSIWEWESGERYKPPTEQERDEHKARAEAHKLRIQEEELRMKLEKGKEDES